MQHTRSKRYRAAHALVDQARKYSLSDALGLLKQMPPTKFDQTVTVSMRLGVDPKQSDQMVRGTCPLPHGSGKKVRVLVFATGAAATAAQEVKEVKAGRVEFKLDKNANIAVPVGKFSFTADQLLDNGKAVIDAVVKSRPATAKGAFVESVTLAATMLPGIEVDVAPFLKN